MKRNEVVLSILMPTKNRSHTAIDALNSILSINSNSFEVVVQDCSEGDILKEHILSNHPNDTRISYHRTPGSPSLTENWNHAISNAIGRFICGIGDDDGVLPHIVEVAEWMEKNGIQGLIGAQVNFIWPDAHPGSVSAGKITFSSSYSGFGFKVDLKFEYSKKIKNCGFGYAEDIPNLYHGIVERELFQIIYNSKGFYLNGTSFDVYNSIALSKYIENAVYLDFPITVRGASKLSNANRIRTNQGYEVHLKEFGEYSFPKFLPKTWNAEVSIAESTIQALIDTEQHDKLPSLNLAVVYGKTTVNDLRNFLTYYRQYLDLSSFNTSPTLFHNYFIKFLTDKFLTVTKEAVLKFLYYAAPFCYKWALSKYGKVKLKAETTSQAVLKLVDFLNKNKLIMKNEVSEIVHQSQPTPWD